MKRFQLIRNPLSSEELHRFHKNKCTRAAILHEFQGQPVRSKSSWEREGSRDGSQEPSVAREGRPRESPNSSIEKEMPRFPWSRIRQRPGSADNTYARARWR